MAYDYTDTILTGSSLTLEEGESALNTSIESGGAMTIRAGAQADIVSINTSGTLKNYGYASGVTIGGVKAQATV